MGEKNKVAHMRKLLHGSSQIFNTHQLREKVDEYKDVPDDENKAYIAVSNVIDEDENKEPRFHKLWTSKNLKKRIDKKLTQDDATYRLLWQGKIRLISQHKISFIANVFQCLPYIHSLTTTTTTTTINLSFFNLSSHSDFQNL